MTSSAQTLGSLNSLNSLGSCFASTMLMPPAPALWIEERCAPSSLASNVAAGAATPAAGRGFSGSLVKQSSAFLLSSNASETNFYQRKESFYDAVESQVELQSLTAFDPSVSGVEATAELGPFLLTEEAMAFEPSGEDVGSSGCRFLFAPWCLEERDKRACEALESHIQTMRLNSEEWNEFPDSEFVWLRPYYIRALYSANFDLAESARGVLLHQKFRRSLELPVSDGEAELVADLQKGVCYWFGRDKSCRAQMFIRLEALPKDMQGNVTRITRCLTFCAEFFLRYLIIAGKFETWNIIFDCGGRGLARVPPSVVKPVMSAMHDRYKGRSHKIYVVNFPRWYGWLASWILSVVPANSASKLQFIPADWQNVFRETCAPHQLEEQYGGTHSNLGDGQFYPFTFPPGPYTPYSATVNSEGQQNLHATLTNKMLTGLGPEDVAF